MSAVLNLLLANADFDRFLRLVLLVSIVVGVYLTLQEIDRALGSGTLYAILFDTPGDSAIKTTDSVPGQPARS